ncbi:GLPGLI family protein [Winogradskyella sp. PAMC22761]|nr:GLPGLI family protein [Winogradskyella sp. PAMC22761]
MKIFFFISLLISLNVYSQNYTIKYEVDINDPSLKWGTTDSYQLITKSDGFKSIEYRKDKDTIIINSIGVLRETKDKFYSDTLKFQRLKNLNKNIIEYTKYNGQVHVKDTLNIEYKTGNNQKTILGYECINLFFKFRGRYYEAYYTKEIPISDGPFKFIGANGLILEVTSFDESVKIKASSIFKNTDESKTLFIDKEDWFGKCEYIFSYNKYVRIFLNQWYENITKTESQYPGSTSSFNSRRIEIFPNKLDPEIDD